MNARRLRNKTATIVLALALLGSILPGPCTAWANPGLLPTPGGGTVYVDFSGFPNGDAVRHGIDEWRAQGWNKGGRSLQLIRAGGYLEIVLQVPASVSTARLAVTHRSGYAPGCASGGFAPVTLAVNGAVLTQHYAPPAAGSWSTGFTTDRWDVTGWLAPGRNRIRITAGSLCSVYEVQRLEISITATTSRLIEDYQMTHNIDDLRPTDSTTAFTPNDQWAVCWTKVASAAIGRRIEFRFYDSLGGLYFKTNRTADRYNWGYIRVRNWRAATLQGQWRVDIYVAGKFQVSLPFHIGSAWFASAPRVTAVDFPEKIRADGVKRWGRVQFHDHDGDITHARFDVVDALSFTPFSFEPDVNGKTSGVFDFRIWASMAQEVTLRVTLIDRRGNSSEPHYFSFRAT